MDNTNLMIEVSLPDDAAFLKIKESLERIGKLKDGTKNVLALPWNIFHRSDRYFIMSYKIGLMMNHVETTPMEPAEYSEVFTVTRLLAEWNLLKIIYCPPMFKGFDMKDIIVVPYKERNNWEMIHGVVLGKFQDN